MIATVLVSLLSLSASLFGEVSAASRNSRRPNQAPSPAIPAVSAPEYDPKSPTGAPLPPFGTFYYFDQLIDHKNPSAGTFKQRYYFTSQYYEPGGPISESLDVLLTILSPCSTNHSPFPKFFRPLVNLTLSESGRGDASEFVLESTME